MGTRRPRDTSRVAHEHSAHSKGTHESVGARIVSAAQTHWAVSLLLLLAAIVASIATLSSPVRNVYQDLTWRQVETDKVESLRRGQTLERLQSQFGSPDRVADSEGRQVLIWEERGYDLRATVEAGAVTGYLVHVCDGELRPSLTTGSTPEEPIIANSTRFADVTSRPQYVYYDWTPAFTVYWEGQAGSRAEAFRDRYWGYWTCGPQNNSWQGIDPLPLLSCSQSADSEFQCLDSGPSPTSFESPAVRALREGMIVNTFGEAALSERFPPPEVASIPPSEL